MLNYLIAHFLILGLIYIGEKCNFSAGAFYRHVNFFILSNLQKCSTNFHDS